MAVVALHASQGVPVRVPFCPDEGRRAEFLEALGRLGVEGEVEEGDETLTFSGGLACRLHHEIEHVCGGGEGRGEPVWTFQVKVREKE